jgi:tripeptide aminopeptidase
MILRAAIMSSLIFAESVCVSNVALAQTVASLTDNALTAIAANTTVIKALEALKKDDDRTLEEQKRIAQIPAPPFKERPRSEYMLKRFVELGLSDAAIDEEGNVIARRKGRGSGRPNLVVSAHQDTVFPEGTDLTLKEGDGRILAPGIGDDARGLATLLSLIQTLNENSLNTSGDITFVATVGEEELGNLRGVKALFRDHKDIDGFISIDGLNIARIVTTATGSHRYEFTFTGPGGHSFQEFGLPSATHAMGRAIAKISDLTPPSDPRTTFTVGTVSGGTSVNAIAAEAKMAVDMRSNAPEELLKLETQLLALVQEAVVDENRRWRSDKMTVTMKLIGDRPAGRVAEDSPIVLATQKSVAVVSPTAKVSLSGSSTDSNVAMSLGIPAVTIGGGGEGGNWHSRNEWYKNVDAYLGPQNALMAILTLVGCHTVSQPTLKTRN